MANMNIGRMIIRMSGGAGNTNPAVSLGGVMSTAAGGVIDSQTAGALTNVTGVVVEDAMGNVTSGNGTLTFTFTPVVQVQTLTTDANVTSGDVYIVTVDGVDLSETFATSNDATLAALAVKIQAEAGVATAVVTDAGPNDRVIVITAQTAGTAVILTSFSISGGSAPNVVRGVTTGNKPVDSLMWQDNGAGENDAVDVSVDGVYAIPAITGGNLVVTVTAASLPGADANDADVSITDISNELFDDISKAESFNGDTEYRCVYVENNDGTDIAFGLKLWINLDASPDDLAIGLDLAGLNGTADTIVDEGTAPSPAVTFTSPTTEASGLSFGDLAAGDQFAFWIRRTIAAANQVATNNDLSLLSFSASF